MSGEAPRLTVYVRAGCHLCDDMLVALQGWQPELGFELETRDVDSDPAWAERFGPRVPVLAAGDTEICHYFLDINRLRAYLSCA